MNDGKAPKKSIFSFILPYILMAATVGVFIWLIVSSMVGKGETWAYSDLDNYLG